jgi:GxxExxY protein
MTINMNYKHSELTEAIIGVFYDAYNELGFGFLESVYRNSMQFALEDKGLFVQSETPIAVFFRGATSATSGPIWSSIGVYCWN